jgi:hypothetical protein
VTCLLVSGCETAVSNDAPPKYSEEELSEVENEVESAVSGLTEYVMALELDNGIDVSISLDESKVSDSDFADATAKACEAAKAALESRDLPLSSFSSSIKHGEELAINWRSEDFISGILLDNRPESEGMGRMTIDEMKAYGTKSYNSVFKTYLEENNITLTAKEVQYDMPNNKDKEFILVGTASLSDYYNYGFDDSFESNYFCVLVAPYDGSYTESWYVYCHRESFKKLFDDLLSGYVNVSMSCMIPSQLYEPGQSNMAVARYTVW